MVAVVAVVVEIVDFVAVASSRDVEAIDSNSVVAGFVVGTAEAAVASQKTVVERNPD